MLELSFNTSWRHYKKMKLKTTKNCHVSVRGLAMLMLTSHKSCDPERDSVGGKLPHFRQGCTSESFHISFRTMPTDHTDRSSSKLCINPIFATLILSLSPLKLCLSLMFVHSRKEKLEQQSQWLILTTRKERTFETRRATVGRRNQTTNALWILSPRMWRRLGW
jgi:hypothetical protein